MRPAAWRRLMLLLAAAAAAASALAAEASCAVCVRTAAELEAQVEMVASGRAAISITVGLCAATAAEPLRLDRNIAVSGFGLAVDLTVSCCAGAGAKCGIERTAPSAGFNFAASTGGVTFTAQDIAFTQAAAAGSPTAPLVGAADTSVADPAVRFLRCRFEGISGSLVPGAVDEDFGAVLNLPFVLTAAPDRDVFESVGCTYIANNSTGSVLSLANLTPAGAAFGARYAVADADFFENGAVAVATRRDGGGPGLDELRIESSYFYRNAGGAVLARDLGAFVLRGSFVHEHALGGASAAVELLQNGTAPSGSCLLEGDEFTGNANADRSYYAQSAALSVTGYEVVEISGSAFSSNFGGTAMGAAVAVAAFDPLAPGSVTAPAGEVRIDSCSFVDNAVAEGASGGAVSLSNIRRATVADSLFSRNYGSALSGYNSYYDEDAPDAVSSRLHLVNSTFEDNAGGGNDGGGGVILSQMEEVVLEDCLFVGQTGSGSGAALFVSNGLGSLDVGAVSIRGTRFERNTIPRTFMFGGGAVMLLSVGRMDIAGSEFVSNSVRVEFVQIRRPVSRRVRRLSPAPSSDAPPPRHAGEWDLRRRLRGLHQRPQQRHHHAHHQRLLLHEQLRLERLRLRLGRRRVRDRLRPQHHGVLLRRQLRRPVRRRGGGRPDGTRRPGRRGAAARGDRGQPVSAQPGGRRRRRALPDAAGARAAGGGHRGRQRV